MKTAKTCLIMAPANVSATPPRRIRIVNRAYQDDQRNYFAIAASGANFDVDRYLADCPFTIGRVWRRGEPFSSDGRPDNRALHKRSSFEIDLGCGADLPIDEQQEIAADFLKRHEAALVALKAIPGVETFYLGIQEQVLRDSLGSLFDLHPPLLQAALRIGIRLTVWTCLERTTTSSSAPTVR